MCPEMALRHLKIEQTAHVLYKKIAKRKEMALTWACDIYQFLDGAVALKRAVRTKLSQA